MTATVAKQALENNNHPCSGWRSFQSFAGFAASQASRDLAHWCRESSTTQNEAKNSDRTGGTFLCPRQRDSVVESTSGIRTAANWFRKRKRGESRTHLPCKLGIGWPTWSRPRQFSANPRKRPPPTRAGATPTREDKRKDDNASCSEDSRKQTIQTDAVYSGLHGWCEVCSSQFYACVRKSAVGLRCHEAALNGDGLAQPIGNQLQRLRRQAVRRRNGMIQRASHVWQNRLKWYRPCGGRRAVNCLQVVYGGMRSCQEPDMVVVLVRERRPTNASCPIGNPSTSCDSGRESNRRPRAPCRSLHRSLRRCCSGRNASYAEERRNAAGAWKSPERPKACTHSRGDNPLPGLSPIEKRGRRDKRMGNEILATETI